MQKDNGPLPGRSKGRRKTTACRHLARSLNAPSARQRPRNFTVDTLALVEAVGGPGEISEKATRPQRSESLGMLAGGWAGEPHSARACAH